MIYKRCSRCGSRIPSGSKCPCLKERHKEYDKYARDSKTKDFYDSKEWENQRKRILEEDGIDVYLYMTSGEVKAADTVHHILPLRECWERRLDPDNLMSLRHDTHSHIEKLYKMKKTEMEKQLSEMLTQFRREQQGGGG